MWQVYVLMGIVVILVAFLWVQNIDYVNKNHPDYKGGNNEGFDFDHDLKDWDVTIADGLDKLEEEEEKCKSKKKVKKVL
jgi:lipopolysaccharide export system protein LptC